MSSIADRVATSVATTLRRGAGSPPLVDLGRRRDAVPTLAGEILDSAPLQALDVGAARGVPPHWERFLDMLRVHAFEPRIDECARLAAVSHPNVTWHPVGLAGQDGPRQLHVLATPTGSSLLRPDERFAQLYGDPAYFRLVAVEDVECRSVASFLGAGGLTAPSLVKLDTQGTEVEILDGFSEEQTDELLAVELEAEFHPVYVGQPLFGEVHAAMQQRGFVLHDMRTQRVHLTGGVEPNHYLRRYLGTAVGGPGLTATLHGADLLYLRPLDDGRAWASVEKFVQQLTILQIYRCYDLIFWMLDQPAARRLVGAQGVASLVAGYVRAAPRPGLTRRVGSVARGARGARRAASLLSERVLGVDGFDPPRTFWTHSFWPDQ